MVRRGHFGAARPNTLQSVLRGGLPGNMVMMERSVCVCVCVTHRHVCRHNGAQNELHVIEECLACRHLNTSPLGQVKHRPVILLMTVYFAFFLSILFPIPFHYSSKEFTSLGIYYSIYCLRKLHTFQSY